MHDRDGAPAPGSRRGADGRGRAGGGEAAAVDDRADELFPDVGRDARPEAPAVVRTSVWTDGACRGNPGPGGWAWATMDGRQDSGGDPKTTNQRMELQAVLEA